MSTGLQEDIKQIFLEDINQSFDTMKEIFNYRYYVLLVLTSIATICTLTISEDEAFDMWIAYFVVSKVIALALWIVIYRAINYWLPKGRISALAKLSECATKIIEQ